MTQKQRSIHAGHRDRVRERYRTAGLDSFSEHEVLELLLMYAIPQRDVNPLAHRLIERFGSLSNVLEADEAELTQVDGVGQNAALLLSMMPHLFTRYQRSMLGSRPTISNLEEARRYCMPLFLGVREEHVYMICLDQSGRVLHRSLLHTGTIDEVMLYPRRVVEMALRHNAHAVLLAHNHPGGIAEPSQADYDTTVRLINTLGGIGIRVLDHLIFADESVYSMMRSSQFDGTQVQGDFSYVIKSRQVPGRRGTLKEGLDDWFALSEEALRGR